MSGSAITVGLIHATAAAMEPSYLALTEGFPEADAWHILDDRLARDADAAGGVMLPSLRRRMLALIGYLVDGGAQGVLLTCSMYSPVVELATSLWDVPVVSSDEEMFAEVARQSPARIVVIGSLESAVASSLARLHAAVAADPRTSWQMQATGIVAPGAAAADEAGDRAGLFASLRDAACTSPKLFDMILIAQYSLTPVQAELERMLGIPVLSPPTLATRALRRRVLGETNLPSLGGART